MSFETLFLCPLVGESAILKKCHEDQSKSKWPFKIIKQKYFSLVTIYYGICKHRYIVTFITTKQHTTRQYATKQKQPIEAIKKCSQVK